MTQVPAERWYNPSGSATICWSINMFGSLGLPELLIILFIVILIFGANRLPGLAKGMGSAIKNFKDGMKDDSADHKS
jgi:sec-independent protein translocase protein TatA